jgi:hypothetical protein
MNEEMNARVFLLLIAARMVGNYLCSWDVGDGYEIMR